MDSNYAPTLMYNTEALSTYEPFKIPGIHKIVVKSKGLHQGIYVKCLDAEILFLSWELLDYRKTVTAINCFECIPSPLSFWSR